PISAEFLKYSNAFFSSFPTIIPSQEVSSINVKIIQKLNYSKNLTLGARLREKANRLNISGRGLKQYVNTRWYAMYDCVNSILNYKEELENKHIENMNDSENPSVWWFSLEDCFPKNEAYLVQLALKLFSVIPHTARVEHVWSRLELTYYSIEKTSNEVYEILMNENLDVDEKFIEITKDSLNDKNDENEIFDEEDNLLINELEFSMDKEYNDEENYSEVEEAISNLTQEAQENVNWDPIAEIDKIVEDL
ncbi:15630_t:CDS:2, partial [Gigaspora rosea]